MNPKDKKLIEDSKILKMMKLRDSSSSSYRSKLFHKLRDREKTKELPVVDLDKNKE